MNALKRSITIFSVALLSALILLSAGCGGGNKPPEAAKKHVLKIGWSGSLCEAPVHIALEKGFFKEEGLEVELIKLAPGTAFDAVTSGQTEAGFSLLASTIQPLANGLPVKITSGLHTGCDKVLTKAASGIKGPADLKGKKIGVPSMSSSPIIFAKRVLADSGVGITAENSEVDFVVYSGPDLAVALDKGAVDAIAMNEPAATIAANEYKYLTLFDSARDKPYDTQYCCVAYVRNNIAADYPDVALKYTRAMQKASAWVQGNQSEAAKIQVDNKWAPGSPEVNAGILRTLNYIPSASGAYKAFSVTARQLQDVGMLKKTVDVDALHKNSFLLLSGLDEKYK
jgi:NitT/TauT family transport system substrate-binding protein